MNNLEQIDALVSESDFKKWREAYHWPKYKTREDSEKEIYRLENLVRDNILRRGLQSHKCVLLEIQRWKTRQLTEDYFLKNPDSLIESKVREVLELINSNPDEPHRCIEKFIGLHGVMIPVASAFLRFLDPDRHRFGIIDKHLAKFFNIKTNNINQYRDFNRTLHDIAHRLNEKGITFDTVSGLPHDFDPVDVEMAIFAYCTQTKLGGGYV